MIKAVVIANRPTISIEVQFSQEGAIERTSLSMSSDNDFRVVFKGFKGLDQQVNSLVDWLREYAEKKDPSQILPLSMANISSFHRQVYAKLAAVPFGTAVSYTDLAAMTNRPLAARAAGTACGKNRFPLFIPCHRVLAIRGKLGGFSCGLEIKQELLDFEQIHFKKI